MQNVHIQKRNTLFQWELYTEIPVLYPNPWFSFLQSIDDESLTVKWPSVSRAALRHINVYIIFRSITLVKQSQINQIINPSFLYL